jgi:hypothetical protein
MHGGVRPPGTPLLGAGGQFAIREAGGAPESEISHRKRIGIAQAAHRDVLRGPGADPGQAAQAISERGPVTIERQPAGGHGGRQGADRRGALSRQPGTLQRRLGEVVRGRKRPCERFRVAAEPGAEHPRHPPDERGGTGYRRLLANDRAHADLERIPAARQPQPRPPSHP